MSCAGREPATACALAEAMTSCSASTAALVEDMLQKRKGVGYGEGEHVLERAYLWVYRDSSNAGT